MSELKNPREKDGFPAGALVIVIGLVERESEPEVFDPFPMIAVVLTECRRSNIEIQTTERELSGVVYSVYGQGVEILDPLEGQEYFRKGDRLMVPLNNIRPFQNG